MSGALSYLKGEYVDRIYNTWIFSNYPIRLYLRNSGKPLGKRPLRLFPAKVGIRIELRLARTNI